MSSVPSQKDSEELAALDVRAKVNIISERAAGPDGKQELLTCSDLWWWPIDHEVTSVRRDS